MDVVDGVADARLGKTFDLKRIDPCGERLVACAGVRRKTACFIEGCFARGQKIEIQVEGLFINSSRGCGRLLVVFRQFQA